MARHKTAISAPAPGSAHAEDRREELARAAYALIAEGGFEELRTRAVAQRVGVNIATLHYYFPTKEALIRGVARYLATQFETLRAPAGKRGDAAARLRREFADAAFYLARRPEMIGVMRELNARARRDRAISKIVEPMKDAWRNSIEAIIAAGLSEGVFQTGMPPRDAAGVIVALLWGAATLPLPRDQLNHARQAVEYWLMAPAKRKSP